MTGRTGSSRMPGGAAEDLGLVLAKLIVALRSAGARLVHQDITPAGVSRHRGQLTPRAGAGGFSRATRMRGELATNLRNPIAISRGQRFRSLSRPP